MNNVVYTVICFVTGIFFGVSAMMIAIVLIDDMYEKKGKNK